MNTNIIVAKNKHNRISAFQIIALYVIMLVIYWFNGSPISLAGYMCIGVWTYFNPLLLLSILGACNYLPAVLGLSPLLITLGMMVAILLIHMPQTHKLRIRLDARFFMLLLIVLWSMVSGALQHDLSFMSNMITVLMCYVAFNLYLNKFDNHTNTLTYLAIGIGFGVILAFFIQFSISGFESFHPFRLAIGERSDPNSTGLLMAIFCTFSVVQLATKLNDGFKRVIPYVVCLLLGLWVLLLTQSRGSILCFGIISIIYLIFSKKRKLSNKGTLTIFSLCLCVALFLAIGGDTLFGALWDALDQFMLRLQTNSSSDGERLYLLEKSFEVFFDNPIFGMSLENFKSIAGHIPHNTFSDYMVTNGLIGIVFFVVMYAVPIVSMYSLGHMCNYKTEYYCYFVCFWNILFYSASNEKMTVILLIILMNSVSHGKSKNMDVLMQNATIVGGNE